MARLLHAGAHSAVYLRPDNSVSEGYVAVKVVSPYGQREPHDVLSEIKILSSLRYAHIVPLLRHEINKESRDHELVMPLFPLSLMALLDARTPAFGPSFEHFEAASKSLVSQMLLAVAHIHAQDVAHRDICPSNFAISSSGNLVLLDFGIAVAQASNKTRDLCTDVGTSAYRPLELIYGDQEHGLRALDLWALGCTIAELFTTFIDLNAKTDSETDEPSEDEAAGYRPPWMKTRREENWRRKTLFEGRYGDITLAGSIYKILGTATRESWPVRAHASLISRTQESARMPSFGAIPFYDFPPQPLADLLPNLPSSSGDEVIDLLAKLLQISASKRTPAAQLLKHRWLNDAPEPDPSLLDSWLADALARLV